MGILGRLLGGGKKGGPGFRGKFRQIYEIAKPELQLTAEQQHKIETIFKEFRGERKGIGTTQNINKHDAVKDARQEAKQEVLAVLTPEQREKFRNNIDKWRDQVK